MVGFDYVSLEILLPEVRSRAAGIGRLPSFEASGIERLLTERADVHNSTI